MKFIDLFAGLGGFHRALADLGHECVFASEIDSELRAVYEKNFPAIKGHVYGDIREAKSKVPAHDVLCAGFPCQPFSKSGSQQGFSDKTRGTLFHEILDILKARRPSYVLLENVGNFERHDSGKTWAVVKESLSELGYRVRGTEHVATGGHGLVSPHHLGYPQTRERFFIVGSLRELQDDPFPLRLRDSETSLRSIEQSNRDLLGEEKLATKLPKHYIECIDHWNTLLQRVPSQVELPSFPIWGDELDACYPYSEITPYASPKSMLVKTLHRDILEGLTKAEILATLPSYARSECRKFPEWKIKFIRQNRDWFSSISRHVTNKWKRQLLEFPPSLRKLEWNCKGEERNLWLHTLQFRPSGLRVKRYSSSPALVAMTMSQLPILGPKGRFISLVEGLRLQGFADNHGLPRSRERAFAALGNAVHVGVVKAIAQNVFRSAT